jgi:hypothetical protein
MAGAALDVAVCWVVSLLYLYRDDLVLSMSFRRYRFPCNQILNIHRYQSGVSLGLKIEHRVSDLPSFVVFWPANLIKMEEALDANAFPVATPIV